MGTNFALNTKKGVNRWSQFVLQQQKWIKFETYHYSISFNTKIRHFLYKMCADKNLKLLVCLLKLLCPAWNRRSQNCNMMQLFKIQLKISYDRVRVSDDDLVFVHHIPSHLSIVRESVCLIGHGLAAPVAYTLFIYPDNTNWSENDRLYDVETIFIQWIHTLRRVFIHCFICGIHATWTGNETTWGHPFYYSSRKLRRRHHLLYL